MNGIMFLEGSRKSWGLGVLLALGVWYASLAERAALMSWAGEAKASAPKLAEEADLPDMPAGAEKPAEKALGPANPKASPAASQEKPAEKAAEKSSVPLSKEKEKNSPEEKPEASKPEAAEPKAPPVGKSTAKVQAAEPIIEWPVNEAHRKNRSEVPKLLRSGTLTADQVKFLTEYYTQYGLARWTQLANRADVRKYRDELMSELRQAEGQAHDQALKIVMDLLTKMAEGNHAPVARLNAVLALGELNRVEPKPPKPGEPLPETQPILLRFLQNPQTPDALQVAALVGLRRHGEFGVVAEPTKLQIAGVLAGLVQQRTPSGRSSAGQAWLRSLAIEVLELLKTPGQNGQVALVLIDVAADTNNPLGIRVAAVRALGNLDYSQGFPGDLNKLLGEMGQVALDALNAELEGYKKDKKLVSRRLQTHLIGVYNGLVGLEKVASQPAERAAFRQKILDAVRACLLTFENPKLRDSEGKLIEDKAAAELTKLKAALTEAASPPTAAPASPAEKPKT